MRKISTLIVAFFIASNLFAQIPNYINTNGLQAWYPFTGNTYDSSGNGNNGINHGATLTTDRFGNSNSAYSFLNATKTYINTTTFNLPSGSSSYSISAWFKNNGYNNGTITFWGHPAHNTNNELRLYGELCTVTGAGIGAGWWSPNQVTNCGSQMGDTFWHHVAVSYNGTKMKMFIDNVYVDSLMPSTQPSVADSDFSIGGQPWATGVTAGFNDYYFQGKLDDIAIYNREISQCEVSKLFLSLNTLIVNQPVNDSVLTGSIATYSITDTGGSATYQWQVNSGTGFANISPTTPYSGVTTKTLTINPVTLAMNGYQYRCVRSGATCTDTSISANLTVHSPAGISFTQIQNIIVVSPNPTFNSISINSPVLIEKLEVINLLGQVLLTEKPNTVNCKIDLSQFVTGTYILKINDNYMKRVVKQ